jgi:SAM-dependent methyltransferase
MELSEYDNIARLEGVHWWYRGMSAISMGLLAGCYASGLRGRILDAGCGTGGMLKEFGVLGCSVGLDLEYLGLAYAQKSLGSNVPLVQGSVMALPLGSQQFDLVVSFDVLYHRAVPRDEVAFSELWRVLKPGGILLLRLPALEILRGAHDIVVHARQRYERTELGIKLAAAGFQLRRLTYANTILLPLIFLRRHWSSPSDHTSSDVSLPSPFANALLEVILRIESFILRFVDLPIGVSLLAVASKPVSPPPVATD